MATKSPATFTAPPSTLDPDRATVAARARRVGGMLTLPELRWAALSLLLFLLALGAGALDAPGWVESVLFTGCYLSGGWAPALAGLAALKAKTLDVDVLMVAAAIGAAAIGQAVDGGLLIVIFATSGALEAVATKRTQDSVRSLLTLAPEQATRLDADGNEAQVDTATLAVGDVVLVRPGERVGADGVVLQGVSEVDQASITGEPLPVLKRVGDELFAGTLNGEGALTVRVEREASQSVVARIVALVEEASATKARTQLFIEKAEQRYSVAMVTATVVLFLGFLGFGAGLDTALLRAMTFMIVASPCAVVLATMPPLLAAIANAGRHGVLVKSAVVMESLGATDLVAFDKTGTLTEGTPRVAEVSVRPTSSLTETQVLSLAAGAERPSEHPVGRAIVASAHERDLPVPDAVDFQSAPGQGVTARVDGHQVTVGSPRLLNESPAGPDHDWAAVSVADFEQAGHTAVVVTVDHDPVAVLALVDRLRPHAQTTVSQLRELTGSTPILLTGDNLGAATRVATDVAITDVRAGLLPEDKVNAVRQLQAGEQRVLVVGDGVNDAPALAAADLGVALGRHGSDLALETADAVIVRDELATLPVLIAVSRRARRVVIANLAFASTVIVGLVGLDLAGHLPLPLGVAGHEGSTVIVGLNGLRLLSRRSWRISR